MRKNYCYLICLLIPFYVCVNSICLAQLINIREGVQVNIDGIISNAEWSDADSIQIDLNGSQKVTVKFKHDGSNFNFVFFNNLESFNIRFPEILLDINNDKSLNWMTDDWWFHVSATDCESNTAANDYSNCLLVQPDWLAVNNFVSGPPMTDTVEIQIPFSKVNFLSLTTDTIGISFDVTNTFNAWNYWPNSLVSNSNPSTWASAVVEFISSDVIQQEVPSVKLEVSPNPAVDRLSIRLIGQSGQVNSILLKDLKGSTLISYPPGNFSSGQDFEIPVNNLESGIYFLVCIGDQFTQVKKIIKL